MESLNGAESGNLQNETEWSKYTDSLFNKVSETSDTNISSQDDVKIKVEIELKEEENGLIYQPDFYGHLRLVSLNQGISGNYSAIENKQSDMPEWHCVQHPLSTSELEESTIVPTDQNNRFSDEYIYGQLKNVSFDISTDMIEKSTTNNFQSSVSAASEVFNYALENTLQQQFPEASQISHPCKQNQRKKELSYILAEKKRNYRMRIKEENPSMWCAMKQKEACKKREQREEKRLILLEMQRMMHLITLPDSPEVANHKLYLHALKERYPEIWKQLIDALSAAEQRNKELMNNQNPKRRLSKPVKMYKDVVEAQKKYLYRQRIKLERPDLYEQQKARDSYARSIRRMLKKKLSEAQNNINN